DHGHRQAWDVLTLHLTLEVAVHLRRQSDNVVIDAVRLRDRSGKQEQSGGERSQNEPEPIPFHRLLLPLSKRCERREYRYCLSISPGAAMPIPLRMQSTARWASAAASSGRPRCSRSAPPGPGGSALLPRPRELAPALVT